MPWKIVGNKVIRSDTGKVVGHSKNPKRYLRALYANAHKDVQMQEQRTGRFAVILNKRHKKLRGKKLIAQIPRLRRMGVKAFQVEPLKFPAAVHIYKGYDPKQPRYPKGNPQGGQWKSGPGEGPLAGLIEIGIHQPSEYERRYERVGGYTAGGREEQVTLGGIYSGVRVIDSVLDLSRFNANLWAFHQTQPKRTLGDFFESEDAPLPVFAEKLKISLRNKFFALGTYNHNTNGIVMGTGNRSAAETFVHEFGHLLDFKLFGGGDRAASENTNMYLPMKGWLDTVMSSELAQRIRKISKDGFVRSRNGRKILKFETGIRIEYLMNPTEMFARSFTQWIGSRSGHRGILYSIRKGQNSMIPEFWGWGSFNRIGDSLDFLFNKADLLRLKEASSMEEPLFELAPLSDQPEEIDLSQLGFEEAVKVCIEELEMREEYARWFVSVLKAGQGDVVESDLFAEKDYNPKQPRWGKGNPQGGQWKGKVSGELFTGSHQRAARDVARSARIAGHKIRVVRNISPGVHATYSGGTIRLARTSKTPHLDTAHELGHLLDHRSGFASVNSPKLAGWRRAVDRSPTTKRWQGWQRAGHITIKGNKIFVRPGAFRYALDRREQFARSYAQHLARRNRGVRRNLRLAQRTAAAYYWSKREFGPIDRELSKLYG